MDPQNESPSEEFPGPQVHPVSWDDPTVAVLPGMEASTMPADQVGVMAGKYFSGEIPGGVIGTYHLIRLLGEGGMGTVWLAEQREPLLRQVALKVIKLGMDTDEVIARFEQERQALALMDHPSIAKVLDAGATATGRPFFVMELVRGVPLSTYCDDHHLPVKDRLELFAMVCHAIQHAHQKGIIHRDIKPSNILVTTGDLGESVPKIIDFGIAKATGGALTDRMLVTRFAQFIGTPSYMSPEQAKTGAIDIDTRSDIYSLGVVLYELLTGKPPFDSNELMMAGIEEMQRVIREQNPPRPSNRISSLTAREQENLSLRAGASGPRLITVVRGDLDWIVMKALEKDRNRRYDSAAGLAADIQRHLENQPVLARPPGAGYVFSRYVRRHRLFFAAGTSVLFALIAGICVAAWGLFQSERARLVAVEESRKARISEERALKSREAADGLINSMLFDLRDKLRPLGRTELLEDVSLQAEKYFRELPADLLTGKVRYTLSVMHSNRGQVLMDQGNFSAARAEFEQLLTMARDLAERAPDSPDFQRGLALAYHKLAELARAEHDLTAARPAAEKGLAITNRLAVSDPDSAGTQHSLLLSLSAMGNLELDEGNPAAARVTLGRAVAAGEALLARDPGNPDWQSHMAGLLEQAGEAAKITGDETAAGDFFKKALALVEQLSKQDPANAILQRKLSLVLNKVGRLGFDRGDHAGARDLFTRSLNIILRLAQVDADNAGVQDDLITSCHLVADASLVLGDLDRARKFLDVGRDYCGRLVAGEPDSAVAQRKLSVNAHKRGELGELSRDYESAAASFLAARTALEKAISISGGSKEWQQDLCVINQRASDCLKSTGDLPGARAAAGKALAVSEQLVLDDPENGAWQSTLGNSLQRVSSIEKASGNTSVARSICLRELAIRRKLCEKFPGHHGWQRELAVTLNRLGDLALAERDFAPARGAFANAMSVTERLTGTDPLNNQWQRDLCYSLNRSGALEMADGRPGAAQSFLERAVTVGRRLLERNPSHPGWREDLAISYKKLGESLKAAGHAEAATRHFAMAEATVRNTAPADAPRQDSAAEQIKPGSTSGDSLSAAWSLLTGPAAAAHAERAFASAGTLPDPEPGWRMGVAACRWLGQHKAEAVASCREYMESSGRVALTKFTASMSMMPAARQACREVWAETLRRNPSLLAGSVTEPVMESWKSEAQNWEGDLTPVRIIAKLEQLLPKVREGRSLFAAVGLWACSLGLDDEASVILAEGVRRFPDSTTIRYVRGLWLWNDMNRLNEAIADFEAIHADSLQRSLNRPERLALYPVSLWAAGRQKEARQIFRTLSGAHPELLDQSLPVKSNQSGWGGWPPAAGLAFTELIEAMGKN